MKPLQVFVPENIIKQLKLKAIEKGVTVSDLVRDALGANVEIVKSEKLPIRTDNVKLSTTGMVSIKNHKKPSQIVNEPISYKKIDNWGA